MFRRKSKTPKPKKQAATARVPSPECAATYGALLIASLAAAFLLGSLVFRIELFSLQFTVAFIIITLLCFFRRWPLGPALCLCIYLFWREPEGEFNYSLVPLMAAFLVLLLCILIYRASCLLNIEGTTPLANIRAFPAAIEKCQEKLLDTLRTPLLWSLAATALAISVAAVVLWCIPLTGNSIRQFRLHPTALRLIQLGFVLTFTFVLIRFFVQQYLWRRITRTSARVYLISTVAQWLHADTNMVNHRVKKLRRKQQK